MKMILLTEPKKSFLLKGQDWHKSKQQESKTNMTVQSRLQSAMQTCGKLKMHQIETSTALILFFATFLPVLAALFQVVQKMQYFLNVQVWEHFSQHIHSVR